MYLTCLIFKCINVETLLTSNFVPLKKKWITSLQGDASCASTSKSGRVKAPMEPQCI